MCSVRIILIILMELIISFQLIAQEQSENKWRAIVPYPIEVTCNKTSNLIFPYNVISVDRGTAMVLVQKAKHVGNILQIKAAEKNADTTNLSVVTADGKFYSFLVSYNDSPSSLNLLLQVDSLDAFADLPLGENQAIIQQGIQLVQVAKPFMHKATRHQGLGLRLRGIYFYKGLCYFKFDIKNQSAFTFDPENIRLVIKDKRKAKRSASQEKVITTLLRSPLPVVDGNSSCGLIIPTGVFSIAPKQHLLISLVEKGSGRIVHLTTNANRLFKVRSVK